MAGKNVGKAELTDGLYEKVIAVNRVSKVVKGGRQFGFVAITVAGDRQGKVGIGYGKAKEVPISIKKAMERARKNMVTIPLDQSTVGFPVYGKFGASLVYIKPARSGTGVIAGGAMRGVFEVLGVQDVLAKCIGSKTALNMAKATLRGLLKLRSRDSIARKRGKAVCDIWK